MKNITGIIHSITNLADKVRFTKQNINRSRFNTMLLIFIMLFCGSSMWFIRANAQHETDLQKGIADKIIRFHVIANSDSDEDQALKLKVKDNLVKNLSPLLQNANSIDDAREIISENIDYIQISANNTIRENGYCYPVKVTLEDCYFPLKLYGNCSFPPGIYEALRVRIGAAEGKNWWCVMFPPLCFLDETYSVVDEKTDKKLKHMLTEEEYDTLVNQKKPIKIKFKLWEKIKKLFE